MTDVNVAWYEALRFITAGALVTRAVEISSFAMRNLLVAVVGEMR
jgi:hypothetical protein